MKRMGLTIFLSLFFVVGFALLFNGLRSLYHARRAASWPSVEGRIISSELEENDSGEDTMWNAKVRYTYSVGGAPYQGDRIAFGYASSSNSEEHSALSRKLQRGSRVMVHYDPTDPQKSVLATNIARGTVFTLIGAAILLTFITGFTLIIITCSGRDTALLNKIQIVN